MNILNRKMFVNGGPAQAEPSIPELIGYYVSQGYNAFEIKEMLPDLNMSDIEAAVSQLGGSVNPAVPSPGANEFEGNFNVLPQIPETTVTANQDGMTTMNPSFPPEPEAPQEPGLPEPPFADLENIINRLKTRREEISAQANQGLNRMFPDRLLKDSMGDILPVGSTIEDYDTAITKLESILQSSKAGYGMSPQSIPENINIDEMMMDPSRPSPQDLLTIDDGLPEITGIGADSSLGDNQYRDSEGVVHDISSEKLRELLNGESSRIISGVLSNPNVSYGLEIAKIIEAEALGRSSTLVDPSLIKVGVQDIVLNPESITDETLKLGVDFVKEGAEGFFNTIKGLGNSRMVGIFRGREAAKKAKDAGRDEYKNIFDTPLSGQGSIADNLREISGYGNTGGETAKTLDSIILEASLSPPTGIDANLKDLEDLEKKQSNNDKVNAKDAGAGTEAGTETETGAGTEAGTETETGAGTGTSADPVGTGDVVDDDKKDKDEPSADFIEEEENLISMIGTAFNSDANLRLMRNIGKGLTQYGNFAEGIGKGSAAAAEEKALRDLEDEALEKELLLKGFEGQTLDYKEANAIKDNNKELSKNIRAFQKNQKNVKEIDKALNIIQNEGGFGIQGSIKKLVTAAAIAMGKNVKNWDNLDPRTKIDAITKVLQQSNIQEILGESGRTISNLDREVIKDVFGSMTFTTSEAEIVKKLQDSRAKTLTASNETRGEIAAGKDYFNMTGRNSVVIEQNKDLIDLILQFDPDSFTYEYGQRVVDVDYRDQFKQ